MSKPDSHMPFYGDDFFSATEMFGDAIALKYLRCVWFYWSHLHCEGIPNDDELMQNLCRCELGHWMRVKGLLFDNDKFFKLKDGKWHQGRAQAEWVISTEKLDARLRQTEAARRASLGRKSVTSPVTDSVTDSKLGILEK